LYTYNFPSLNNFVFYPMNKTSNRLNFLKLIFTSLVVLLYFQQSFAQIENFDKDGKQIIRFSTTGDAIDAHDGEIADFNGIYYLYGTSYDCGFQWGNKGAPFCGFKVYSSKDLNNWTDRGYLFDAKTPVWQSRCDGKTYGCFRPHVIYNKTTKRYVLWINVYDNVIGYRVFTSTTPVGPFMETAEPKLAVNNDMPAAGLNNGDHDTFVDDDGTAYLAYTDWRTKGTIVIEQLSADYLTGTGKCVKAITPGETEAPGLFKRNGIYYVVYSDPNCGYCSGTGTSYRTAPAPLGPWSEGKKISDNSCGGQPSFISTIKINSQKIYLYGSDLWNNAAKNEALANYYWAPLTFAGDGSINPLNCMENYQKPKALYASKPADLDHSSTNDNFSTECAVVSGVQIYQPFSTIRSGILTNISVTIFKNNNPDKDLIISIYVADQNNFPTGNALFVKSTSEKNIGWSAKNIYLTPKFRVIKDDRYVLVLKSEITTGCYGLAFTENPDVVNSLAIVNLNAGKTIESKEKRIIKFKTFIKKL
jgi:hypothetical protein